MGSVADCGFETSPCQGRVARWGETRIHSLVSGFSLRWGSSVSFKFQPRGILRQAGFGNGLPQKPFNHRGHGGTQGKTFKPRRTRRFGYGWAELVIIRTKSNGK